MAKTFANINIIKRIVKFYVEIDLLQKYFVLKDCRQLKLNQKFIVTGDVMSVKLIFLVTFL